MAIRVSRLVIDLVARTASFERSLRRVERRLDRMGSRFKRLGDKLTRGISLPLAVLGGLALKTAIDFESAFAGVEKTVNATTEELAGLRKGILELSKVLPATAVEIAGVAEAAGQLGIKTENILEFTKVMINLGETTNLSARDAATAFARLANIMGLPQDQFDRLGSSLVELGNNLATTEAEILELGLRLAGAANLLGISEAAVLGMAGALSSLGVNAQAGGTALSTAMIKIAESVDKGGSKLRLFAKVAGLTASQFRKAFKEDAAEAIATFIEGLGKMKDEGKSLFPVLAALDLNEKRLRDSLLRAAGAGDLLRKAIALSTKAFQENKALTEEVNKRYKTAAARLSMLRNRVIIAAVALGDKLSPAFLQIGNLVGILADKLDKGIKAFGEMTPETQRLALAITGLLIAIGPVLIVLGFLLVAISALASPFIVAAATISAAGIVVIARWRKVSEGLTIIFKEIAAEVEESLVVRAAGSILKFVSIVSPLFQVLSRSMETVTTAVGEQSKKMAEDFRTVAQEIRADVDLLFSGIAVTAQTNAQVVADTTNDTAETMEAFTTKTMSLLERLKGAFTEWRRSVNADLIATKKSMRSVLLQGTTTLGALTGELATGKKSFDEWATSVVKAIAKVLAKLAILKIFKAGSFGRAFGGGFISGAFAQGGRPPVGRAALVGENGPELFIPDSAGTIVPSAVFAGAGAGGGMTIINNLDFTITGLDFGSRDAAQRVMRSVSDEVKRATILATEFTRRIQDSANENEGRAF